MLAMEAIPDTFEAKQIDSRGRYRCPLCDVQTTADEVDAGWVFCPMLEDRPICLGCCLDYQNVARLEDYDTHPYRTLFDEASAKTGKKAGELRKICLSHQENILLAKLEKKPEEQTRQQLLNLLTTVRVRIKELSDKD